MDLFTCYRCASRRLTERGEYYGCIDCGLWTEKKRYGKRALPLRPRPVTPQTQKKNPRTTTLLCDETSQSESLEHKSPTQRVNRPAWRKTFRDPRGP